MGLLDIIGLDPDELPAPPPHLQPKKQGCYQEVKVHFATDEDLKAFAKLLGLHIDDRTTAVWYPPAAQSNAAPGLLGMLPKES